MQRNPLAYLVDIVEACDGITSHIAGLDEAGYRKSRLVRSAVEREFTIIGEALGRLYRDNPALFAALPHARQAIAFRNRITHDYLEIDDGMVWGAAVADVPRLRQDCHALLAEHEGRFGPD